MTYEEIKTELNNSRNPLISEIIESNEEDFEQYRKMPKTKETIKAILSVNVLNFAYTRENTTKNYECCGNPYFIALINSKKFSDYEKTAEKIKKELSCGRRNHVAAWDMVGNRRCEFDITKLQINPFIRININTENMELINKVFKSFHRDTHV